MEIYKILRAEEWAELQAQGQTQGAPVDVVDGFVHFSNAEQVAQTAAKWFEGIDGLWLLAVDAERLGTALQWEPARAGALFPHLYGPLRLTDVLWAEPLPWAGDRHSFPDGLG